MDSVAFSVNGMFTSPKVRNSTFVNNTVCNKESRSARTASVRMVVDPFQRQFQSFGKINVDYSRPKKLASYKRSGYSVMLDYPNQVSFAGKYSISNCGKTSGANKILMKYDEYCAKGMMQVFKRSAVPFGYYTSKCTEGTVKGAAHEKRAFNRTQAFRQSQKPVNVRLNELYEARRCAFIMANNCSREEDQFKGMPISCATYMQGKAEMMGTCYRTVVPGSTAEDYIASGVRSQLTAKSLPWGEYGVGSCMEGFKKGDAEERRVAALAAEFRAQQQSAAAITGQQYESSRTAVKLYASDCHHEQQQLFNWPATAAALCRY